MHWYIPVWFSTNNLVPFLDFSYSSWYKAVQGISLESCRPEQDSTRQYKAFKLPGTAWYCLVQVYNIQEERLLPPCTRKARYLAIWYREEYEPVQSRFVPEVRSALDDDLDPSPCEEDEEFFKARPNAEEMEQAISIFLDVMPALETDNFQNRHRQLPRLPLPNKGAFSSMTHDEAVDAGLIKTMKSWNTSPQVSSCYTSTRRNTGT